MAQRLEEASPSAQRRILHDPSEPPLVASATPWNELCAHAREAAPEECCGLIGGTPEDVFRSVYRCRNDVTRKHQEDPAQYPRDGQTAFFMNEGDYLRATEQAAASGESITAVYHSHVGAGAYFSELDQAFASQAWFPFPDAYHVVISLVEGRVEEIAAFKRTNGGFRGRQLVPGAKSGR